MWNESLRIRLMTSDDQSVTSEGEFLQSLAHRGSSIGLHST